MALIFSETHNLNSSKFLGAVKLSRYFDVHFIHTNGCIIQAQSTPNGLDFLKESHSSLLPATCKSPSKGPILTAVPEHCGERTYAGY